MARSPGDRQGDDFVQWYSIAGDAPVIASYDLIVDGIYATPNGRDDDFVFARGWSYGTPADAILSINITVNRGNVESSGSYEFGERVARSAPHLVLALDGVGDRARIVAQRDHLHRPRAVLMAVALSGNAVVTAKLFVSGPLETEAGVAAHGPVLAAILTDAIAALRLR